MRGRHSGLTMKKKKNITLSEKIVLLQKTN